jgi:hypothetical protein
METARIDFSNHQLICFGVMTVVNLGGKGNIRQVKNDQESVEGIDEDHSGDELKLYRCLSFRISSPRTTAQPRFDG